MPEISLIQYNNNRIVVGQENISDILIFDPETKILTKKVPTYVGSINNPTYEILYEDWEPQVKGEDYVSVERIANCLGLKVWKLHKNGEFHLVKKGPKVLFPKMIGLAVLSLLFAGYSHIVAYYAAKASFTLFVYASNVATAGLVLLALILLVPRAMTYVERKTSLV